MVLAVALDRTAGVAVASSRLAGPRVSVQEGKSHDPCRRAVSAKQDRRKPCKTPRNGQSGRKSLALWGFYRENPRCLMSMPEHPGGLTRKPPNP